MSEVQFFLPAPNLYERLKMAKVCLQATQQLTVTITQDSNWINANVKIQDEIAKLIAIGDTDAVDQLVIQFREMLYYNFYGTDQNELLT